MITLSHDERYYLVEAKTKIDKILIYLCQIACNEREKEMAEVTKSLKVDILSLQMIYERKNEQRET